MYLRRIMALISVLMFTVGLCSSQNVKSVDNSGSFTDNHDGHEYKWVIIGSQVWMAENLAYLPYVNPPTDKSGKEKMYYVNGNRQSDLNKAKNSENYKTYGVLYNWAAVMDGLSSSNEIPSKVKGVCPTGWHVPSMAEWKIFGELYGEKQKKKNKTIREGFNALLGGGKFDVDNYTPPGAMALFWSSTEMEERNNFARTFNITKSGPDLDYITKTCGYSVRCIKDNK